MAQVSASALFVRDALCADLDAGSAFVFERVDVERVAAPALHPVVVRVMVLQC